MKIDNNCLQRLYKLYLRQKVPSSRNECPSLRVIINFFSSKSSERQKNKILDHITDCYYCAQEFEFILQILRCELKINSEISNFLNSEKEISTIKERSGIIVSDLKKEQKKFFPRLSWKYSSFLLGGIIIAFIFIILIKMDIFQIPREHQKRSEHITQSKIIKLNRVDYSKNSLSFKWNEIKNSDYYILELFDDALAPVWNSEKIFKNHYIFPQEYTNKLDKNRVYFWIVTAYLPSGEKIESTLEEFTLIE